MLRVILSGIILNTLVYLILSFIAKGHVVGGSLKVSSEHSDFRSVPITEARSMVCTLRTKKAIETFY